MKVVLSAVITVLPVMRSKWPRAPSALAILLLFVYLAAISPPAASQAPDRIDIAIASLVPEVSYMPGLPFDWDAQTEQLWQQYRQKVSYCVGTELTAAAGLLKRSFPLPLVTHAADPICASNATIFPHLCGPQELAVYLKFLLFTDDVEKLPSNMWCDVGDSVSSCAPGFFQTLEPDVSNALAPPITKAHACCPGYFCPAMLTCMIPCPLGSYCPRAWPADAPASYTDNDPDMVKPVVGKGDKWCAPYSYKMRSGLGCGGAHKWTIHPEGAFPLAYWPAGSGNLYCDGGSYCPDPVTRKPCRQGHFCKQGSSQMTACPALAFCPAGTDTPQDNRMGFVLDMCLFLFLALLWNLNELYHRLMRRLSRRERVRVMWHQRQLQVTVVEVAAERTPAAWTKASPSPSVASGYEQEAGRDPVTATTATSTSRFGFLKITRRRSKKSGGGGASSAGGYPVWASFDAQDGQGLPLLEHEMQPEGGREGPHRRSRSSGSGVVIAPSSTLQLEPIAFQANAVPGSRGMPRMAGAAAGARLSSEAGDAGPFIAVGQHTRTSSIPSVTGITGSNKPLLEVGFEALSMRLKSCGKLVLQECKGQLKAWRVTAIMGPSGAGKTTLMTALAGKASYGVVTGTITINGRPDRLDRHKRLMGFVPQDDVMYRNLTVEENLTYSACFRLPGYTSQAQRMEVVVNAIAVLGLGDVRHSLIGDEEVRGISGGQRKRVNVGIELVADPSLIFLDEPTSGLDSTASKLVVQALKRVAQSGVTVVAVIHQPSYETFSLFDDLVLLAKGGLTAYCGPQQGVQAYFEGLGFAVPEHVNPADAFLDIVSGALMPISGAAVDIAAAWKAHQSGTNAAAGAGPPYAGAAAVVSVSSGRRSPTGATVESDQEANTLPETQSLRDPKVLLRNVRRLLLLGLALAVTAVRHNLSSTAAAAQEAIVSLRTAAADQLHVWVASLVALLSSSSSGVNSRIRHNRSASLTDRLSADTAVCSRRSPPGLVRQFYWCLNRAVLMRTREPVMVFIEYMIYAITGSFLGLMSDRGRGSIGDYVGNVVYNIVALGMLAMVSGIKMFSGPERLVFYREASAGLSKLAYFWAVDTWGHVGLLLRCAVYLSMYYSFSQPRAVLCQMYMVTCAIYYACTGMAYGLSQVMSPNAAQLTAAVAALINALVASKFSTSGVMGLLNKISYARWGLEGYVIAETNYLTGVWLLARCADLKWMQYDINLFWYCIKMLMYIGFGSRIAACLGLLLLHKDKTL